MVLNDQNPNWRRAVREFDFHVNWTDGSEDALFNAIDALIKGGFKVLDIDGSEMEADACDCDPEDT